MIPRLRLMEFFVNSSSLQMQPKAILTLLDVRVITISILATNTI